MAKVYLAIQRAVAGFEKLVVIKRILPELSRDQAFVEMLLTEARTAATLNHPNIVQTFDVGSFNGTYYIAMEHINGEDIRSIVRAMKRCTVTEFPLEHTLNLILGVSAGLAYAHEKRDLDGRPLDIVHRDVSPQNILVTFTGDVKVVDFGIAKTSQAAFAEKTGAGQLKGKVPYMSPEQAQGLDLDHRSDIFAVGIILFELTTGRRLFKARSEFETLKLICERDYPRPTQIRAGYPPELERIVMKALAKDRDERYQSARDMQADLEGFIRQERIAVSAVSLANWMRMLFEDKIAEQKEALQDVKQLADVIASQRSMSDTDLFAATTTGAATLPPAHAQLLLPATPRSSARWWFAGAVVVLVLAAAGVFAAATRGNESSGLAQSTSPAPPAPVEPPAAPKGKLAITSEPDGAYVRIAGELQSQKTPATIDKLPLGMDIEVKISKEGFEDHVATVRLSEARTEDSLTVKLARGTVTLEWTVNPKGAQVVIDGRLHEGPTTRVEELSTGEHKVVFSAAGHIPQLLKFVAQRGENKKLVVMLQRGDPKAAEPKDKKGKDDKPESGGTGTVNVASRGGYCTNVVVGGRSVGPTPVAGISVPAGPVGISCRTADGRTIGSGTVVKNGEVSRVTITIPPKD
jgi:serine/threonine-protein kinase